MPGMCVFDAELARSHGDRCYICWRPLNPRSFWHSYGLLYCSKHCCQSPKAKALEEDAKTKPPYTPEEKS